MGNETSNRFVRYLDDNMLKCCQCKRAACRKTGMPCVSRGANSYLKQFEFATAGNTYRATEFLNSGAHAHAFLVHQVLDSGEAGRTFCCKFFLGPGDKELRQLATICDHQYFDGGERHANIVNVITFSAAALDPTNAERPGRYGHVLMELAHMGEVLDYIYLNGRVKPFSEAFGRRFFRQMLLGLKHMHKHGVWHRDLKPENTLLDMHGNIKLCDFGLSKAVVPYTVRAELNALQTTILATAKQGSPSYMAPEVKKTVHRRDGQYNERADIWSAGCTLLVLLCGNLPPQTFYRDAANFTWVLNWMRRNHVRAGGSGEFSDPLINMLRAIFTINHHERPSLEEVLQHEWLQGEEASDTELARLVVERNPRRIAKAISWADKVPDALLAQPNRFYPMLVGKYVKQENQLDGTFLLHSLGLGKYVDSDFDHGKCLRLPLLSFVLLYNPLLKLDTLHPLTTLETYFYPLAEEVREFEMLSRSTADEIGMSPAEHQYLARSLSAGGYNFEWIRDAYDDGISALAQALVSASVSGDGGGSSSQVAGETKS